MEPETATLTLEATAADGEPIAVWSNPVLWEPQPETLDLVSGRRGLVVVVQAKMTVAVSGASSSLPLLY